MKYKHLFSKGKIGRVLLKNRAVMCPMSSEMAESNGEPSEQTICYYEERARGGIGLIIVELCGVDDEYGIAIDHQLRLTQDFHIQRFEKLADAAHRHGTKIFAQLYHGGAMCNPSITGNKNVSASSIGAIPDRQPRPLEKWEIAQMVQKFTDAARRAQRAGFDGVEVHAAHGYLLAQFLSKYYNQRTDEYGGSFENRVRFLDEIIHSIRAACGHGYGLIVRFSGDEMAGHLNKKHMTLKDGLKIAQHLDKIGLVDALDVSNGGAFTPNANCDPYSYEPGWKKHIAKSIRETVSIPVIANNTIKTPDLADQLLEEGFCDFVGLGRSQFADPEFVRKAKEGREEEIRACIGCMYCRETMGKGNAIRCAINPRLSNERTYQYLNINGAGRRVVVVGGGPSGLESARVLAERGFAVTLFEQNKAVGGTLNLADQPPHKEKITRFTNTLKILAEKAGVEIRCGTAATPELVRALQPTGVFLAIGAVPIVPNLPGIDSPNVYTAEQVIRSHLKLQGRVVVVGTGMTGLETAEMLGISGSSLVLVEMMPQLGPGLFPVILNDLLERMKVFPMESFPSHKLIAVEANGIVACNLTTEKEVHIKTDHVVLSLGVKPREDIIETYEEAFDPVIPIGDTARAGRIYEAVKDGYSKAFAFEP